MKSGTTRYRSSLFRVQREGPADPLRITTEAGARLNSPEKAAILKRKVQTNPAEKKRNVHGTADPNVSARDRLSQFKGEHITVVSGKLRCDACKKTVCKKRSSVSKHITSQKH